MRFPSTFLCAAMVVLSNATAAERGTTAELKPATPEVKLAVIISVDQLRADYLERFRPYFGAGGFKRLLEGGADFRNCHFRHALTQTAPGHATISTGVHANVHGITSNEWLDPETWEIVNNVEDRAAPLVGPVPQRAPLLAAKAGRSPRNLRATTVADQLKLRYGARSKVFSASNKDRSAILLGGKLADSAYWDEAGQMVTSSYYHETLPAWVEAFNAERPAEAVYGQVWERMLPVEIYDAVQGPDDAPGESVELGYGRTFPRKIDGGGTEAQTTAARADGTAASATSATPAIPPRFYAAFDRSPFSPEMLGRFVERALHEEQLGRHAATDMLCVSFSQLDDVGHAYGPDSHEVMDSMLRLDRVFARMLDAIDREVGLAHCVIVLSADHGCSPMPERIHALRPEIPAGRVEYGTTDRAVRAALDAAFGALPEGEYWFTRYNNGYHLRPTALAARHAAAADAARVVQQAVRQTPFIAQVYTREEILAGEPEGDSLLAMVRRSYYAARDRDVVFVTHPYFYARSLGTTHGVPYDYDTHVPQLWFGAGVPKGVHVERVGVDDIAPTLAGLLGIPAPPQAVGRRLF